MRHLIEKAATVFQEEDGFYTVKKDRYGEFTLNTNYSEEYVRDYVNKNKDALIIPK